MELKDYVSETLKQIISGVQSAQEFAQENGAVINGSGFCVSNSSNANSVVIIDHNHKLVQNIEFDVEITTTSNDNSKGGFGIFVGPLGAGAQEQIELQNSSMNHIKFSVPLILPQQNQEDKVTQQRKYSSPLKDIPYI